MFENFERLSNSDKKLYLQILEIEMILLNYIYKNVTCKNKKQVVLGAMHNVLIKISYVKSGINLN